MKKNSPGRIVLDAITWMCGSAGAVHLARLIPSNTVGSVVGIALFCVVSYRIFLLKRDDND